MGAVGWNYSSYTWHTNRDTYDNVVFDDLTHNATLAAMMAYLASEDRSALLSLPCARVWSRASVSSSWRC